MKIYAQFINTLSTVTVSIYDDTDTAVVTDAATVLENGLFSYDFTGYVSGEKYYAVFSSLADLTKATCVIEENGFTSTDRTKLNSLENPALVDGGVVLY